MQLEMLANRNEKELQDDIRKVLPQALPRPHSVAQETVPRLAGRDMLPSLGAEIVPCVAPERGGFVEAQCVDEDVCAGWNEVAVDALFHGCCFGEGEP